MKNIKSDDNPIKRKNREKQVKAELTIKAIICILLTNIVTYMYCQTPATLPEAIIIESNMKLIRTPIINMASSKTRHIALYDSENNLISRDVELIEQLEEQFEEGRVPAFYHLIKIKTSDLSKFKKYKNRILHAYPRSKNIISDIGEPYEI